MQTLAQLTQFVHESELVEASGWKWFWKLALSSRNQPTNEFATIAIKMVNKPPPPKKKSNGPIFMYNLMKSCLTSHSMLMLALNPMVRSSSSCPRKMSSPFPPESSKPSNPLNHLLDPSALCFKTCSVKEWRLTSVKECKWTI